ncbi:hypothetical protein HDV06_005539 [Boothiomyces sp. JEL0866]|nr:hypothetical protein HDV06_005539 [Boothiomyces sp. JEL0866]
MSNNNSFYSGIQARLEQATRLSMSIANQINQPDGKEPKEDDTSKQKTDNSEASEFERLKKMESRFVELARAYKALKSKYDQVENIITQNSTITELKLPTDFTDLENMIKSSQQSFEADKEIKKLLTQINDMKQSYEKEADTNADMYSAMQTKLISREEEINRLKHKLSKLEGASTPTEDASGVSTPTSTDPITLKLKIRELATALKNVTEQRNSVIEKLKNVEANGGMSSTSSQESLPEKVELNSQLEAENSNLKMKINTQLNTISALKSKIQTLTSEHESVLENSKKLTSQKKKDDGTIAELRSQASAMVDDLAELTDESEKLKSKIATLNQQLKESSTSNSDLEQVRQEARERYASLEYRLRTVQQKLETSENSNAELLNELTILKSNDVKSDHADVRDTVQQENAEIDRLKEDLFKLSGEKEKLQKELQAINTKYETLVNDMENLRNEHLNSEKTLKLQVLEQSSQLEKLKKELQNLKKEKHSNDAVIKEMKRKESEVQLNISALQSKIKHLEELRTRSNLKESELLETNLKLKEELDSKETEYLSKSAPLKQEISSLKLSLKQAVGIQEGYESTNQKFDILFSGATELILALEEFQSIVTTNDGLNENLDVTTIQNARELISQLNTIYLDKFNSNVEEIDSVRDDQTTTNEESELVQKLNELAHEVRITKSENIELQNSLNNITMNLREKSELVERNLEQKKILEGPKSLILVQLAEYTQMNEALQSQIQELEKNLEREEGQDKQEQNTSLENLNQLNVQIQELKGLCIEKDQQIAELLLKGEKTDPQQPNLDQITEINESVDALQDKVKELEEERLSLTEKLGTCQNELGETQKRLALEEEKKTKSIQLLRNSKNRILKLENELQTKVDEAKKLQEELESKVKVLDGKEKLLKEKEFQISGLLLQKEEQENRLQKMHALNLEIDTLKKDLSLEQKKSISTEEAMTKKLEELKIEHELKLQQYTDSQLGNEQGMKNEIIHLKGEIEQLQINLLAADNRIENIDAELSTSKSLFEMKCIENDNLKLSISEMEVKYFECSQDQLKMTEEYSVMKNAVNLGEKRVEEIQRQLHQKQKELENALKIQIEAESELKKLNLQKNDTEAKLLELEKLNHENQKEDQELMQHSALLTVKIRDLEEKLNILSKEKVAWTMEKDNLLSDFRMREFQLKNLNKTLKEEVKKLSRPGSSASSVVSSPRLSRADSHDIPPPMKYSPPAVSPTRNSLNSNKSQLHLEPEYLKNVVLKFLESNKRAQRVQLVGVLGMLLNFTPDELRAAQKTL